MANARQTEAARPQEVQPVKLRSNSRFSERDCSQNPKRTAEGCIHVNLWPPYACTHTSTTIQANQKKKHTVVWMPVTKNKGEYPALVSTLAWTKAFSKTRHGETRVK